MTASASPNRSGHAPVQALVLLLCLMAFGATALEVPRLTGRVVDQAKMLSPGGRESVEAAVRQLEQDTGGQMAVLTVPSLDGDALEDFSMRVAEAWKIGSAGQDNGLILLIARDERKMRLEVGYGWEGTINDARAGDIIRGMKPYFQASDFDGGVLYATAEAYQHLTGRPLSGYTPPQHQRRRTESQGSPLVLAVIAIVVLASFFGRGARNRRYYRGVSFGGVGWSGGSRSGSFGGGSFRGGGGSFGGGGASGGW